MDQLDIVIKASRSAAFASLVRILGNFDLAEDAIQEAIVKAVIDWRKNQFPDNPVAWLVQTGRRYAIDILRHADVEQRHRDHYSVIADSDVIKNNETEVSILQQHDDQLRLIFTCCHPALSLDAQVALSLKTVASLSVEEIARAYLLPVKTLQQRLTRAKQKIRETGIAYEIPREKQIAERLEGVMSTLYLIYTQAYTCLSGADLVDSPLSEAAIYLGYMLNRLIRGNFETQGLLALMLLQHARVTARVDDSGLPVPLEQQNRENWDQQLLSHGLILVEKFRYRSNLGCYQIQAAIAAVHCRAKQADQTDWQQIVILYEMLEILKPDPVITLNRAIAVARVEGVKQGLVLLESLAEFPQMEKFQYYHSARAGLLYETGEYPLALVAFKKALALCENDAEKRYLQLKIDECRF